MTAAVRMALFGAGYAVTALALAGAALTAAVVHRARRDDGDDDWAAFRALVAPLAVHRERSR